LKLNTVCYVNYLLQLPTVGNLSNMSCPFSICIPRVFGNISNKRIVDTFENMRLGLVRDINIIWKTNNDGANYKMAFIHFDKWNDESDAAMNLRKRIEDPNLEARVVYDDPWYWVILPNNSTIGTNREIPMQTNNTEINKHMMQQCLYRIVNLENELHSVYEELYQREYIPDKYLSDHTEWSIDLSQMNHSDRGRTDNKMNSVLNDIVPYYDECYSNSTTGNNSEVDNMSRTSLYCDDTICDDPLTLDDLCVIDTPLHKPSSLNNLKEYSENIQIPLNINIKQWMTVNYCGNE